MYVHISLVVCKNATYHGHKIIKINIFLSLYQLFDNFLEHTGI